jgi:hypothetical protein
MNPALAATTASAHFRLRALAFGIHHSSFIVHHSSFRHVHPNPAFIHANHSGVNSSAFAGGGDRRVQASIGARSVSTALALVPHGEHAPVGVELRPALKSRTTNHERRTTAPPPASRVASLKTEVKTEAPFCPREIAVE